MTYRSVEFSLAATFSDPRMTGGRRPGTGAACCLLGPVEMRNSLKMLVGLKTGEILHFGFQRGGFQRDSVGSMEGHVGAVRCLADVKKRSLLFSGGEDRVIRMWDISQGPPQAPVQLLYGHGGCVLCLCWHDIIGLLSSSTDGLLSLWGERSSSDVDFLRYPAFVMKQQLVKIGRRDSREMWFTSISAQGTADKEFQRVLVTDSDGHIRLFKLDKSDQFVEIKKMKVQDNAKASGLLCVEQSVFATSAQTVKMFDMSTLQQCFVETGPAVFTATSYYPKERALVLGDVDGYVGMYGMANETKLCWVKLEEEEKIIQLHCVGDKLWVLSPRGLKTYDMIEGIQFAEINHAPNFPIVGIETKLLPQGDLIYSASGDNEIRIWDFDTLHCVKVIKEKDSEITCMALLPVNLIVTGHEDGAVRMWIQGSDTKPKTLTSPTGGPFHANTVTCAAIIPSSIKSEVTVALGSYDSSISFCVFKQHHGDLTVVGKFDKLIQKAHNEDDEVIHLATSERYPWVLFSAGNEGYIYNWDPVTKLLRTTFRAHKDAITAISFDKNLITAGSKSVKCWSVGTERTWAQYQLYDRSFSGDGPKALWEVNNSLLQTVRSILIGPDDAFATASNTKVHFWEWRDADEDEDHDEGVNIDGVENDDADEDHDDGNADGIGNEENDDPERNEPPTATSVGEKNDNAEGQRVARRMKSYSVSGCSVEFNRLHSTQTDFFLAGTEQGRICVFPMPLSWQKEKKEDPLDNDDWD